MSGCLGCIREGPLDQVDYGRRVVFTWAVTGFWGKVVCSPSLAPEREGRHGCPDRVPRQAGVNGRRTTAEESPSLQVGTVGPDHEDTRNLKNLSFFCQFLNKCARQSQFLGSRSPPHVELDASKQHPPVPAVNLI